MTGNRSSFCLMSYYIQSAFSMLTEEKRMQEKASLVNVNDSFKKIILVKDVMNVTRDEDGITTMSIYDFCFIRLFYSVRKSRKEIRYEKYVD